MKRILLILIALCLFAISEAQIGRYPFARAVSSGASYGPELNPDVPCENTAYWYEFGGFLAQAGGMTCVAEGYTVSNPNSGWDASGDFHIVVTVANYSGAGSGLRVTYGYDLTVDYITADGTYTYDVTATNGDGIYIDITGANCTITSLSIRKLL